MSSMRSIPQAFSFLRRFSRTAAAGLDLALERTQVSDGVRHYTRITPVDGYQFGDRSTVLGNGEAFASLYPFE